MNEQNIKELFLKIKDTTLNDISHLDFNLKELMMLEKKRLGFKENDLVFISAGDFSRFYWCPMQTYFAAMNNEIDKFIGYLQDRIEYSIKLDKLKTIPKTIKKLLLIGNDINLEDISTLLKLKEYQNIPTKEQIDNAKKELKTHKLPTQRGHFLETIYAKKFPQLHWVVKFNNFIFTCEPDGITDEFVYEFKSSKNRYFSKLSIEKAKLQSDIYSICFNKKNKLIDQLIIDENKIETIKEEVDINRVNLVIKNLKEIIKGNLPTPPNERFKCKGCEYKGKCKIKHY